LNQPHDADDAPDARTEDAQNPIGGGQISLRLGRLGDVKVTITIVVSLHGAAPMMKVM
jgi:hypothetical protein